MKTTWPRDIASARKGTASARVERREPAPSQVPRWGAKAAAAGVLAIAVLIAGATRWMAHSKPLAALAASSSVAPGNGPAPTRVDRALPEPFAVATGGALLDWSGRVQTEAGQALPGARVCAAPGTAELSAEPSCATTDAGGRFALSAPASTLLCASLAGYLPLSQRVSESSSRRPLVLVLRPGGVRVSGDVVDASGGPIAGATLRALRSPSEPLAFAVSDTAGRFELTVASGLVRIDVEADGYSQLAREIRAPLGGVRFALSVESAIVGRVLGDDSDLPWAGATVTAVEQSALGAEPWSVLSAADGSFRFASLPAGRYELVAVSELGRSAPSALTLGVAQVSDPVELRVLAATRLSGSVRVDEAPCERGSVVLQGPVAAYAPLAADGSVAFDGLWPGQYRIQVSCDGARSLEEPLELALTPMSRVWELERGLAVRGRALTAEGAPLALASIDVSPVAPGEGLTSVSCQTDELGHFSCGGLSPGAYESTIGPGVPPRSEPVRVEMVGGETPEIVLRARPLGELHVHVAPADRFEVPALAVIAQSDQTTLEGELRDDVFVFEAVPLGSYVLSTDPSLGREARRVELTRSGQV
ncbi:MAG TPA: carboxypeptidase-like regulatory domain-containing protein, partial [Polyangiaceae bacterium]|nr:carboxypeptidase-like regulatory domain-containing protein [Polyangiaceae bacterium]